MSFRCDYCQTAQPAKTKPVLMVPEVARRPKVYEGHNEEGQRVTVATGWEAEAEYKACPSCAGVVKVEKASTQLTFEQLRAICGTKSHAVVHVRGCKKLLDDCAKCQNIVKLYANFNLQDLNVVSEEPIAQGVKVSFGSLVFNAMMDRTLHSSKRAKNDFKVAAPILKRYERTGKGI